MSAKIGGVLGREKPVTQLLETVPFRPFYEDFDGRVLWIFNF